ncbi:alpha-aminoadipate carrier protein LysW [Streptomyces sp. 840.1]|uniref:lysine biosynthesis protein LysW n=1 Tax=Streptomyces sp. 840.1 TaxID=2485152 RepID=UPI000F49DB86|nr:lysine biosynthesis protein LysW [Streptomyces sp. 840.1]ROQ69494.1 alpha-aminoadipate carrier protein LysW [Streptomyces sp. 840.1]
MAGSVSECPECHATITADADVMIAEIIDCVDCSAGLEVVSADPLILALAPEAEEDWGE